MNAIERRAGERVLVSRPAAIYREDSTTPLAATTCDVSGVGLLLRVPVTEPRSALKPGSVVRVVVSWGPGALPAAGAPQKARISRVLRAGDHQLVGVELMLSPLRARRAA